MESAAEQASAVHALAAARHHIVSARALKLMGAGAPPSLLQEMAVHWALATGFLNRLQSGGASCSQEDEAAFRDTVCVAAKVLLPTIQASRVVVGFPKLEKYTVYGMMQFGAQSTNFLEKVLSPGQQQCGLEAAALVAAGAMAAIEVAFERGIHARKGLPPVEADVLSNVSYMLSALNDNIGSCSSDQYPPKEDVWARLRLAATAAEAAEAILRLLGFLIQNHQRLAPLLGDGVSRALAAAWSPALKLLRCSHDHLQPVAGEAVAGAPYSVLASGFNAAASAAKAVLSLASLTERELAALNSGEADTSQDLSWQLLSSAFILSSVLSETPAQTAEGTLTAAAECHQRCYLACLQSIPLTFASCEPGRTHACALALPVAGNAMV